MYVNDLLLVDLVEIPRGSVSISRGVIRAYIENLLELWPKKEKRRGFSP